jgi:hypothetical protein
MKKFLTALTLTTALVAPAHAYYVPPPAPAHRAAAPAYRAPAPVYRRAPVYRPAQGRSIGGHPIAGHPVVGHPGHPVVGGPVVGHPDHRVVSRPPHPGPHSHHGMHGHFYRGQWVVDPNDPTYDGIDDSAEDQGDDPTSVSNPDADNSVVGSYGAIATSAHSNIAGLGVSVAGVAVADSPEAATALAVKRCESQGGGGYCTADLAFEGGGCGYVSVGRVPGDWTTGGDQSVAAGVGATRQVAYAKCMDATTGLYCKPSVGYCTSPIN